MTNNTDYLRFSAYSLKQLITRKLAADTKYTDLVYEGSNLAILIDIVCYMYQCLMFNINNAASEAMWSDTLVYENINRLSKLIGYNPKGCTAATAVFTTKNDASYSGCTIPKYSLIDTNQTDDEGRKIYFSTVDDVLLEEADEASILMYNGIWKLYSTAFVGSGEKYQTLILDKITSDSDNLTYVLNDMIHVYIKEPDSSTYVKWQAITTNLFLNSQTNNVLYTLNDTVYNVRLNEYKQYEVTFGNGYIGKIPQKGSLIYIFYLDSNGPTAKIDLGSVSDASILHSTSLFGMTDEMYEDIFLIKLDSDNDNDKFENLKENAKWTNSKSSTNTIKEESVDDIRINAPEWSKIGNRLVTASDWEYFIKNTFKDNILDVKCLNNWQYIASFYKWLYDLGLKQYNNPTYYLTKSRMIKYDYQWADAADSNNVYLWIKTKNDSILYKDVINDQVQSIKVITEEPVYVSALDVAFSFCSQDVDQVRQLLYGSLHEFDPDYKNYLEITLDDNTLYSNSDILSRVIYVIKNFFDEANFTLGSIVNSNDLANKILEVGNITRIRTVYKDDSTGAEVIQPGISFATWTVDYINIGDDVEISTVAKSLEPFQFPKLYKPNDLSKRIKIIKKTMSLVANIQY